MYVSIQRTYIGYGKFNFPKLQQKRTEKIEWKCKRAETLPDTWSSQSNFYFIATKCVPSFGILTGSIFFNRSIWAGVHKYKWLKSKLSMKQVRNWTRAKHATSNVSCKCLECSHRCAELQHIWSQRWSCRWSTQIMSICFGFAWFVNAETAVWWKYVFTRFTK